MEKNFTLKDVTEFLKNKVSFTWGGLIHVGKKLRQAKLQDFDKRVLLLNKDDECYIQDADISEREFMLYKKDGVWDYSTDWKQYLINKETNTEIQGIL